MEISMENGKRPNILWICTDQQRLDTLGCYGNRLVRTPNIDRLAANGVRFTHAYCQAPVCAPSRASFLTGRYPRTCRIRQNGQDIPENELLVTKMLHDAGYIGGLAGKLHLGGCAPAVCKVAEKRTDDGYDYFAWSHDNSPKYDWVMNSYSQWLRSQGIENRHIEREDTRFVFNGMPAEYSQTKWCTDRAIEFIEAAKGYDRPWFFSLNCFDPHHPFDPPKDYLERYLPMLDEIPLPSYVAGELDSKTATQQKEHRAAYGVKGNFPYDEMTEYDHKIVRAACFAPCDLIDEQVGRLLDHLEQSGQLDDTIVIFQSDHGESLGDHGMYLKGCYFYEASVRVPLIFYWKDKFSSGITSDALVELIDIAPTLLEVCGLEAHAGMQGRSLLPLLCGKADVSHFRDDVFCEYYKTKLNGELVAFASMLCDGKYKISQVHDLAPSYSRECMGELYDLTADPEERVNRYYDPEYASIKLEMLEKFCNRQALTADPLPLKSAPW